METRNLRFLKLLPEIWMDKVVSSGKLNTADVMNLSLVSRQANTLFQPILFQRLLQKYVERSAKRQMRELLKRGVNIDIKHLTHACLAALKQGDIGLCRIILEERLDILKQINLPKKLIDENNNYDFSTIITVVESDQNEEVFTREACDVYSDILTIEYDKNVEDGLIKFRMDLDGIVKEKGFPYQALLDAYSIYDKKNNSWTPNQCKIFHLNVIGYLQRLTPAWLKKALVTGLKKINAGIACGDTFTNQDISVDPELDEPNSGIGFDFTVNSNGQPIPELSASSQWYKALVCLDLSIFINYLENLLAKQQQNLENLGHLSIVNILTP